MIHQLFNYLPLPPTTSASNDKAGSFWKEIGTLCTQSSSFLASALLLFLIQQTLLLASFILFQVPHEMFLDI